uniref:Right handed beta helix domain-containing protein n=1 Tax=Tetradesmus obliquus TaxID=3088 RepID=A0A383WA53_TETOB|eukprot:jgi/Sobl393_1/16859/SZX74080.1
MLAAKEFSVPWRLALLVFGSSIRVRVAGARILHNNAGSAIAVAHDARAEVTAGSLVVNNHAVFGAGAVVLDRASFTLSSNSSVSNNTAYHSGGAIHGSGASTVVIQGGSQLSFNSASQYGGALQADETCTIVVRDALLLNNTSAYGGATAIKNSARLQVQAGAVYKDNYGEYGACIAAQHSAVMVAGVGATFQGNSGLYGGVVAAQNLCNITLTGASFVANKGTYGGCLAVQNTGTLEVGSGCIIQRCKGQFGGGIAAVEESRVTLRDCTIRNCSGTLGGAVYVINVATLLMDGTLLANNTADAGGGLAATLQSRTTLVSANITGNYAKSDGGAIYLKDNSTLDFSNASTTNTANSTSNATTQHNTGSTAHSRVIITGNRAKARGGGVAISGHSSFDVAAVLQASYNNSAEFDADASVPLQRISVVGPSYISGLASRFNRTSGTLGITVNLTGIGGLPCGGRPVQASNVTLQPSPAVQVLGASKSNAQGLALLAEVKLRARPGTYTLAVASTTDKDVAPALVHVEVRSCEVGEVTNELGDACEPCSPGSYSLDPANFTCDACPLHASCPGGSTVVPLEGYWHSSTTSPQIHACPNAKACSANRTTLLQCLAAANTSANSSGSTSSNSPGCAGTASAPSSAAAVDGLCEPGYSGNLCGVCKPGYGASTAFSCLPCMPLHTAVALYATAAIAMLLFVRLLTHITIIDNEQCAAVAAAAAAANAQAALLPPAPTQPAPTAALQPPHIPGQQQQQQQQQHARAGPSKDVAALSFVPRADQHSSLSPAGSGPEPEFEDPSSPFASQHSSLSNSKGGFAHPPTGYHHSSRSNASIYFSSRSLPACEEPIPGATAKRSHAAGAMPGQSSLECPLESVKSIGSCGVAGGFAGAGSGSAATASSGALPAGGAAAAGSCCRASDILKVLVLYLQYMLLVGGLRVPWPPTLLLPIKALTWFLAASSSQTLSLECLIDVARLPAGLPMAMVRVLFYTLMPLATFALLLLVEVLARLCMAVLPALMIILRNRGRLMLRGYFMAAVSCGGVLRGGGGFCSWSMLGSRVKRSFEGLGSTSVVLLFVCCFFYLPSVVRYGLSMFVCVKLDDPHATPYAWAAAAPGTYFLLDLNEKCWAQGGWHRVWALAYGVPLVLLLCAALPLALAGVVWTNKQHLHAPWFRRRYGWVVRVYRPERAAWEAVVVVKTVMMCMCAVFGMALGVYHQTLLMAAICAGFAVLLMVFEPHEERQLQHLLVYAFGSLFITLMAALSFLTSFNDIEPPYAYSVAVGAVVLSANLAYIAWAALVLKRCIDVQGPVQRFTAIAAQLLSKVAAARLARSMRSPQQQRQQQQQKWMWRRQAPGNAV